MRAEHDPGRVVILGCGPTGLGAAYRLEELVFHDYVVIEAHDAPGGLASSVRDPEGFTWDIGGHVGFSHYPYYDDVLDRALGDRWVWHQREAWIWTNGRLIPYPFQLNLHRLETVDREAALAGLEQALARRGASVPAGTFQEWILATFGTAIAELFMFPYNSKVWGYPLDQLGAAWIDDRVAPPDLDRIRHNIARNADDLDWGPNSRFRYPLDGGTGAIWTGVGSLLPPERLRFGEQARQVSLTERAVTLDSGRTVPFDTLVTTMPLDLLMAMTDGVSAAARRESRRLVHSSVHLIGIGLVGAQPQVLRGASWMYFPDDTSPYHRVTVLSNYSPRNVPPVAGCWSLLAEVCETPHRAVDAVALPRDTLASMRRDQLVPDGARVASVWHHRVDHGYPTPFVGRDRVLGALLDELEAHRVFSRGRFGAWKYEVSNQDHSFMQGVELANRLLLGQAETTLRHPGVVNARGFARRIPSPDA